MTLAIVGSRKLNDYDIVEEAIEDLGFASQISFIVSGGATGADTLGSSTRKFTKYLIKNISPT